MKTDKKRQMMAFLAQDNFSDARAAGYSFRDARAAGYPLSDALAAGYSLRDARAAGYSFRDARAAGYPLSDALAAGYSLSDARAAGYPLSDARAAGYSLSDEDVPFVANPYTRMLADIQARRRLHNQSTFGPDADPETNLCRTPMCTAGHMVHMAGAAGYELKNRFGWHAAASLLFEKAHPGWPQQNYGSIPQEWALAHIETMAEREAAEANACLKPADAVAARKPRTVDDVIAAYRAANPGARAIRGLVGEDAVLLVAEIERVRAPCANQELDNATTPGRYRIPSESAEL